MTGAFGYSGRYIARRLLGLGHRVFTLTNSKPDVDPFEGRIRAVPLAFDRARDLTASLEGVDVLYNTYWVRFNHRDFSHALAVANTKTLIAAARDAGVRRFVHVSITNPSDDSALEYFRGKAELERALAGSGLSCAILRPTVLFGIEDILINNIAWMLRRFPLFPLFGQGDYRLQPIYVDDLAQLAIAQGAARTDSVIEAIGPETFTYRELVSAIGEAIGRPRPLIAAPPSIVYAVGSIIGTLLGDVLITKDEIRGLMEDRLWVDAPPAGSTRLTNWAKQHGEILGRAYANELGRRARRGKG